MPMSGSYYYPQVQKPTSTLGGGSADLAERLATLEAIAGKGRLFVSGSDGSLALWFRDDAGNLVNLEAAASASLTPITGAGDFFVDNDLDARGTLRNSTGHLILSSSVGSIVTASGSLRVSPGFFNNPAIPALQFGDGNTGFYESADNALNVATQGSARYEWNGDWFKGSTSGGPGFRNIDSTDTQANIFPDNTDTNTGIGAAGADQLSLIAGGVEGIRVIEDGQSVARVVLTGSVKDTTGDPTSPKEGEVTINTSDNAIKIYAGGAWRTITTW